MSESKAPRTAVIIGAGPAGLTAAYELLTRTDFKVLVLEKSGEFGGISRTVRYKGNRIDIGGHRFFSKSDRVMQWWLDMLPMEATSAPSVKLTYHRRSHELESSGAGPDPRTEDRVMLLRERTSRIYYLRRFFDYPVSLSPSTVMNLGLPRTARIGLSYLKAMARPIKDEKNLEEFFINRFGRELYLTFFKDYTEKVWGRPCKEISAEWGAQRIKGLNITKALANAAKSLLRAGKKADLSQKETETSLIEQFLYPKFGPGQMWEECARRVQELGGRVLTHQDVVRLETGGGKVRAVVSRNAETGEESRHEADVVFSTMPVQELVRALDLEVPAPVREISEGLPYRDFLTVGLLLEDIKLKEQTSKGRTLVRDNWIYVQESDVQVGRLQIFNNWSPYMVADPSKVWVGLEYFCNEGDALWNLSDAEMIALAKEELARIDIIDASAAKDAVVVRQEKAYPAYFGTYARFDELRGWLDGIENLLLVGRNGMHKYNNQDHSMLTAMTAVDNLVAGITDKSNLWAVNTEEEYHEVSQEPASQQSAPAARAG